MDVPPEVGQRSERSPAAARIRRLRPGAQCVRRSGALRGGGGTDTFYGRDLNLNPVNDYNSAEDIVNLVTRKEVLPPAV